MKIFRFFLLFLILYSAVFAEEKNNNQKAAIYLHPMLVFGLLPVKDVPLMVQLTGEVPLNKFNYLIIDPSLVIWERESGKNIFNLGTGVGVRHFLSKKAYGFYLQSMLSARYVRIKETLVLLYYNGYDWEVKDYRGTNTGASIDILGYLGYSVKFSSIYVFHDIGLGFGWSKVRNYNENDPVSMLGQSSGIAIDINLGIGIPF